MRFDMMWRGNIERQGVAISSKKLARAMPIIVRELEENVLYANVSKDVLPYTDSSIVNRIFAIADPINYDMIIIELHRLPLMKPEVEPFLKNIQRHFQAEGVDVIFCSAQDSDGVDFDEGSVEIFEDLKAAIMEVHQRKGINS